MEGLKEAIEFITNLKEGSMEPKVLEINGNTYCNKNLTRYHYFPKADSLRHPLWTISRGNRKNSGRP